MANLHPYKVIDLLIRAFRLVVDQVQDAQIVVVGGAIEKVREFSELVTSLGLQESIGFAGSLSNASSLMRQADIAVSSSFEGKMPNSVLEAAAMGTVVVATDVGGTREILANGRYGVLVPPGDYTAIAGALIDVCSDFESFQEQVLNWSSWLSREFSSETMVLKTLDAYHEAIKRAVE